jgi:uncharacterized RmlC-like cupin family protein
MSETELASLTESPYQQWIVDEGVPLHKGFAIDLRDVEVSSWARFGAAGAVINVAGRGDWLDLWLLELSPGGSSIPQHHLFEAVVYVISGHGSTTIESANGKHSFEWGPRSAFALPLNCHYQFFNSSGSESARLALTTSFPLTMNLYHDDRFIFSADYEFSSRFNEGGDFDGTGYETPRPGRTSGIWMTNFVPDLGGFDKMQASAFRGASNKTTVMGMADGVLHEHMSEIATGGYKKAHRHPGGTHIYPVTGEGYSLLWFDGEKERTRVDWQHGFVYSPPDNMYHQHFNVSTIPARYFAVKFGSYRYPMTERMAKYRAFNNSAGKMEDTQGIQIEYDREDPSIKALYLAELEQRGLEYHGQ